MSVRIERFTGGKAAESGGAVTVGEIVLDRGEKRNAMTPEMLGAFMDGVEGLSRDDAVRAIVVRGEGRVFCAGFDLKMCHSEEGVLEELLRGLSGAILALRRSPKPVVMGAHGAAVAGAAALLGGADLVVADMGCRIGYPVVKIGISPAVSAPTLERLVGAGRGRERLLDPALIDAERAKEIGMVHVLVPVAEDVTPRVQIEAMKLACKPPGAVSRTKAWVGEVDGSTDGALLARALRASLGLVGSEEQRALLGQMWSA